MTVEKYQEQMLRLSEVFGAKHYSTPRLKLIFNSVRHCDGGLFERAVSRLIMSKRATPLVLEIGEALEQVRAEDIQSQNERAHIFGDTPYDQLAYAAKGSTADPEFVQLCLKTQREFLTGRMTNKEFNEACDSLDALADQINPKGKRRDLFKVDNQWVFTKPKEPSNETRRS